MSLRKPSFALVVGWFAMVGAAQAETVSFPKENPAFTVDVPKDAQVKYDSDRLSIRLANHFGNITFSALPDKVHDDASARAELAGRLSTYTMNYSGLEKPVAPEVPMERRAIGPKAHGFLVEGAAGNYAWIEKTQEQVQPTHYLAAVFTFDDAKYFSIHSEDDVKMEALLKGENQAADFWGQRSRIIESIKPVR
ncbi:MAG: hypothetical protein QOI07_57 [Verrucomicrobiota bacterium]|jgi:hypothetical protein